MAGADASVALGGHVTIGAQATTTLFAAAAHAVVRLYLGDAPRSPYLVVSGGVLAARSIFGMVGGAIGFEWRRVFVEIGGSLIRVDGEWDHIDGDQPTQPFNYPFLDPLILPWALLGWRYR